MATQAYLARLDGRPDAVPQARRLVSDALAGTDLADVSLDAELIVSELVTNALLHGAPPVTLEVRPLGDRLRIAVSDGSRIPPVRARASVDSMTGRGIALVDRLSERWAVERAPEGKTVWAEVGQHPESAYEVELDVDAILAQWDDLPEGDEVRYTVTLGDVPTELLLDAKAHVDNIIREFALAAAGAAAGSTTAVPPHLARLIAAVTTRFSEARQSIKRQALAAAAAGLPRTHLTLTMPLSAAEAGEDYLKGLDESDAYARAERLLTLETPPQHRAFRRWYVTSLVELLRRAAAGEPPSMPPTFEEHLLAELRTLATAQRATDRAARLQRVTASLAGATTPEEVASVVVSEGVSALGAAGGSLLVPAVGEHLAVPGAVGYPEELVAKLREEPLDADLPAAIALRTGEPVWLESRQERDRRFSLLRGLEPATISMCALPLVVAGRRLGALRFSFDIARLFDEDERRFALALAAQTAQALERAWLFASERAARERTAFLADAIELLTSSLDALQTLDHLNALVVPTFAEWAVVYLQEDGAVHAVAVRHHDPDLRRALTDRLASHPLESTGTGPVAEAMSSRRTQRIRVVPAELRERINRPPGPVFDVDQPCASMVVPLIARGAVVGAIVLTRTVEEPYTEDDVRLIEDVAARAAVAVLNAQAYERERETALTLQRTLLPQQAPDVAGIEVAWRYLPARTAAGTHVGGDWYDVLPIEDGRVVLVIGDVMGRGLQAAAIMGQLRATARAHAATAMSPGHILTQLDVAVNRLEQGQITTAAIAVLDASRRKLTLASAGHLPLLVVPLEGEPYYIDVEPGPPLGAAESEYEERAVDLPPRCTLLLFTDGLVEDRARSADVGMEVLRGAAGGVTHPQQLCDTALSTLGRDRGHDDDTALLAVALTDDEC